MSNDYIPSGDEAFLLWAKNLYSYAQTRYGEWKVPVSPQEALEKPLNAYDQALTVSLGPNRGHADVHLKNETRDALKHAVREYVKAWLINNPFVSDDDKIKLGLPIYDLKPSHSEAYKVVPKKVWTDSSIIRQLTIHAGGRPDGVHGMKIKSAVLDHLPQDASELTESATTTTSSHTFTFSEAQRGKHFAYFLCWLDGSEHEGPFTEIFTAIIP